MGFYKISFKISIFTNFRIADKFVHRRQKDPEVFSCNLSKCCLILMVLGRNVNIVSIVSQNVPYFRKSPLLRYMEKQETRKLHSIYAASVSSAYK